MGSTTTRVGDITDRMCPVRTYWLMTGDLATPTYKFVAGRIELVHLYRSRTSEYWVIRVLGNTPHILNTEISDFAKAMEEAQDRGWGLLTAFEEVPTKYEDAGPAPTFEQLDRLELCEEEEAQGHGGALKRTRYRVREDEPEDEDWIS